MECYLIFLQPMLLLVYLSVVFSVPTLSLLSLLPLLLPPICFCSVFSQIVPPGFALLFLFLFFSFFLLAFALVVYLKRR